MDNSNFSCDKTLTLNSIEEVNKLISSLQITYVGNDYSLQFNINYVLNVVQDDNQTFEIPQIIEIFNKIPVEVTNRQYSLLEFQTSFNIEVLRVDHQFFNLQSNEIIPVLDNQLSDWVKLYFQKNVLYLQCYVEDLKQSTSITFHLEDRISKLKSESVEFWLFPYLPKGQNTSNFVTICFVALVMVIIVLISCLVYQ